MERDVSGGVGAESSAVLGVLRVLEVLKVPGEGETEN